MLEWTGENRIIRFVFWMRPGSSKPKRKIAHTGAGFVELAKWLSAQTNQSDSASIGVALETSSGPVVDCLLALGYRRDAFVLTTALYLEPQALRALEVLDADALELRERHRLRGQLVRTKMGIVQKIRQGVS